MSSFAVKTKVFSGVDAFEYLKGYPIQNVYIITDPFAASSGTVSYTHLDVYKRQAY